jgi:hypothetical protein
MYRLLPLPHAKIVLTGVVGEPTGERDELLSVYIADRIIKIATDFYVNNKVSRLKNNVVRLEHRTDSIGNLLNNLTYSSANDAKLMLNLNLNSLKVRHNQYD